MATGWLTGLSRRSIMLKLLLGYAVVVVSVLAVSLYAILQFKRLSVIVTTSLTVDADISQATERLLTMTLELFSHEQKYLITGDTAFQELFEANAAECSGILARITSLATRGDLAAELSELQRAYDAYIGLVRSTAFDARHPGARAPEASDRAVSRITDSLKNINVLCQVSLSESIQESRKVVEQSIRVALVITILVLACGLLFAYIIIRSMYLPLQRLKTGTYSIAHGDFSKTIDIATEDEIGELAASFNMMSERLRALDELKSDFISNITHDLKTPLASITEASQLMLDGTAGELTRDHQHLLHIVCENTERLLRLIEKLIDLSKLESGLLTYAVLPVHPTAPVIEALQSIRLLARKKHIRLCFDADDNLPEIFVDADKIVQALINIFSNAIKFTPEGGAVTVEIRQALNPSARGDYGAGSDGAAVMISISDTGAGIAAEDLPFVFDKFYQGDAGHKARGDGLGLAIVRHIIRAHRGHVWADSTPSSGTTFTILLPLKPPGAITF